MNGRVSIIIPIYNAQQYLSRCIKSIINQTYINLEIILINDGSTDKSLEICKSYKKADKRIIIIDKKNTGASNSRNIGIEKASGEFLMFVDSDDYLLENYVEEMLNDMYLKKVNVVKSGYNIIEDNIVKSVCYKKNSCILDYNDYKLDIINTPFLNSVWGTLYKSKLVKKYRFNENLKYVEDWHFTYNILKGQKLSFLHNTGYQYIINAGSLMHTYDAESIKKYFNDNLYVLNEIKLDSQDKDTINDVINSRILTKLNYTLIKLNYSDNIKYKNFKLEAQKIIGNLKFNNIKNKNINYENKINIFRCILLKKNLLYIYFLLNIAIKKLKDI